MALVTSKLAFAHLPKTGGQTIRSILSKIDDCREIGDYHSPPMVLNSHGMSTKVFISIRHPLSWYRSRWYHRIRNGWQPEHPVDWECANNDFNKFVNNLIEYDANGRLSTLVKMFMKKNRHDNVDFIIKNEDLFGDLRNILFSVYGNIDNYNDHCDVVNKSGDDEKSSSNVALYDDSTVNRLLEQERWIIDKFYS